MGKYLTHLIIHSIVIDYLSARYSSKNLGRITGQNKTKKPCSHGAYSLALSFSSPSRHPGSILFLPKKKKKSGEEYQTSL